MSGDDYRRELAKIPYGVSVVTAGIGGLENGLTVSWLSQVSFDPPQIMFSIDKNHYSNELLEDIPGFVVNVLGKGQLEMAGHFAQRSMTDERKIDSYSCREAPSGLAVLADAVAYFDCEVVARHEAGDHWLIIGQVTHAETLNDGPALTTADGIRYSK